MEISETFIDAGADSYIILSPVGSAQDWTAWLSGPELNRLDRFASPRRKAEWAAWRALVRRRLGMGIDIKYDSCGAPLLVRPARCGQSDPPFPEITHIGVSHCHDAAAVIFSPRPCAVDVERLSRNYKGVADRYVSTAENALPQSSHPLFPAIVWCAKEAAYKYVRMMRLDLIRDICIESITFDALPSVARQGASPGVPVGAGSVACRVRQHLLPTARFLAYDDLLVLWIV